MNRVLSTVLSSCRRSAVFQSFLVVVKNRRAVSLIDNIKPPDALRRSGRDLQDFRSRYRSVISRQAELIGDKGIDSIPLRQVSTSRFNHESFHIHPYRDRPTNSIYNTLSSVCRPRIRTTATHKFYLLPSLAISALFQLAYYRNSNCSILHRSHNLLHHCILSVQTQANNSTNQHTTYNSSVLRLRVTRGHFCRFREFTNRLWNFRGSIRDSLGAIFVSVRYCRCIRNVSC